MQPSSKERLFVKRILVWFSGNKRTFPWRKTSDPYKILITEHLLRKTTAKQVKDIYEAFFVDFPNFTSLAESPKDRIIDIIRPLGLQNQRAELLQKTATRLVELEGVPNEEKQLLELPGVGQYCADAVRCLAYDEDMPMVDRNVIRVINRIFCILPQGVNPSSEKAARFARNFVREFLPRGNSKSFNLALLDFAAIVCKAKNPLCSSCPQKDLCNWQVKAHSSSKLANK